MPAASTFVIRPEDCCPALRRGKPFSIKIGGSLFRRRRQFDPFDSADLLTPLDAKRKAAPGRSLFSG
jgi:hypothetical protein